MACVFICPLGKPKEWAKACNRLYNCLRQGIAVHVDPLDIDARRLAQHLGDEPGPQFQQLQHLRTRGWPPPQGRKFVFAQQIKNEFRIALVRLVAGSGAGANLGRVPDAQDVPAFGQQGFAVTQFRFPLLPPIGTQTTRHNQADKANQPEPEAKADCLSKFCHRALNC